MSRPTPAELWTAAYDVEAAPLPSHKLLVCKAAQAASLAACLLTGNRGFIGLNPEHRYPERKLRKAARQAICQIDEEDRRWVRFFKDRGITPLAITDEQVNRDDLGLVGEISACLNLSFDLASTEKMLQFDRGPYRLNEELRARLRVVVQEIREGT